MRYEAWRRGVTLCLQGSDDAATLLTGDPDGGDDPLVFVAHG